MFFSFEKQDEWVPFADTPLQRKHIDSLWTGSLESNKAPLLVGPRTEPFIHISTTDPCRQEKGPCQFQIEVGNPTTQPLRIEGAFILKASQKPGTRAELRFRTQPRVTPLGTTDTFIFELPAQSTQTFDLDLTQLPLNLSQRWNHVTNQIEHCQETIHLSALGGANCVITFIDSQNQTRLKSEMIDIPIRHPTRASQPKN